MRGLQAQSVPLGTDVVMSVRLSKPAAGKAVWRINGGQIPASHTRIKSDTREELYTLTIAKERIQKVPVFFYSYDFLYPKRPHLQNLETSNFHLSSSKARQLSQKQN